MYDEAARWYDRVHGHRRDYAADAATITALVRERSPGADRLLDLACGTGGHLAYLCDEFRCTGLDLSAGLIEVAAAKLPEDVDLHVGDMTTFELDARFDVITCLWSSIAYVVTPDRLRALASRMARHLTDGGIAVVEPWFTEEDLPRGGMVSTVVDDTDRPLISVTTATSRDGSVTHLRRVYVVGTPDRLETIEEHHVLGLFSRTEYLDAFGGAGFDVEWFEDGLSDRGLLVARLGRARPR